jgi:hypothetical protein
MKFFRGKGGKAVMVCMSTLILIGILATSFQGLIF